MQKALSRQAMPRTSFCDVCIFAVLVDMEELDYPIFPSPREEKASIEIHSPWNAYHRRQMTAPMKILPCAPISKSIIHQLCHNPVAVRAGKIRLSQTFADLVENTSPLNIIVVVGLELNGNAVECLFQGILRGGIDHLVLNTGVVRGPSEECNLVSLSLARSQIVVDVIDSVSWARTFLSVSALALGIDKLLAEGFPIIILTSLLDHNFLVIVGELIDDVFDLLRELQLVKFCYAIIIDLDSCCS